MKREEKIFLQPDDGLSDVLKKLKSIKAKQVILNIPEGSALRSTLDDFHELKDAAERKGITLAIESTDPYIEEFASLANITSVNPIFGKCDRFFSDIIPRSQRAVRRERATHSDLDDADDDMEPVRNSDIDDHNETSEPASLEEVFATFPAPRKRKKRGQKQPRVKQPFNTKRVVTTVATVAILLFLGSFLAIQILPRATVTITLQKTPLSFSETVMAGSDVFEVSIGDVIEIPGELLTASGNLERSFPATGTDAVEQKATGEIYIYNKFSSSPQVLIDRTRFETPDGTIFRLVERVTVPGAEVDGGTVTPSRIKVVVEADEAGASYNITPSTDEHWTIPGFKEAGLTERFEGFYGVPVGPMAGGFSGTTQVPTENDIEAAQTTLETALYDSLKSQMMVVRAPSFTFLDDAPEFSLTTDDVQFATDGSKTFSLFAEATLQNIIFEEDTLQHVLIQKLASPMDYDFEIVEQDMEYSDIVADWDEGTLSFTVSGSLLVKPKVDEENLREQLANQEEDMVKSIIFNIPGLERATVSLWPFWVHAVPDDPQKIILEFQ